MNKYLEFIGIEEDYHVYKNTDGFMEGYKKIGKKEVDRKVTNQTTLEGFAKYIRGLKKRTPIKDKPLKPHQLPNIPFPGDNG